MTLTHTAPATAANTQAPAVQPTSDAGALPRAKRWNVEEYAMISRAGVLRPDVRTELIDGKIYEMAGMGTPHLKCSSRTVLAFYKQLDAGTDYVINQQLPVRLDEHSEPEPDVSIFRGGQEAFEALATKPSAEDLALLIEIADSSYDYDRTGKLERYARAGIAEYWIVNLNNDSIEQYTQPRIGDDEKGTYDVRRVYRRGSTVETLELGAYAAESILGKGG